MSTSNNTTKRCTKCGNEYPATREYYSPNGNGKLNCACKSCRRESQRQWVAKNPDKSREINKKWHDAHIEQVREYHHQYFVSHREEFRNYQRAYRKTNLEKIREGARNWRAANPDKVLTRSRKQYITNPDKYKGIRQRRLARKRGLPATFTNEEWERALAYFNGVCAYCGNPPRLWDNPRILHRDHVIPLSDPRPNNPGYVSTNIVPACCKCNHNKHNRNAIEWLSDKYGKQKAAKIMAKIEVYFQSLTITPET